MTLNTYELTSIYKNADTRFQITCILRSAIDRYIPGAFGWRQFSTKLHLYYYLYYLMFSM